jgi:hypothetical protein
MRTNRRARLAQATAATALLWLAVCEDLPKLPSAPSDVTSGVTIYVNANFLGGSALLTQDVSNLDSYSGWCKHETGGYYSSTSYDWNDCVSSLKVAPGWRATVYKDPGLHGDSLEVTRDVPNDGRALARPADSCDSRRRLACADREGLPHHDPGGGPRRHAAAVEGEGPEQRPSRSARLAARRPYVSYRPAQRGWNVCPRILFLLTEPRARGRRFRGVECRTPHAPWADLGLPTGVRSTRRRAS